MSAVAIIPAHNEAPRIGGVLQAALGAKTLSRILVVDDGSTDGTAQTAASYGVQVLRLTPNRGKGLAMRAAVQQSTEPVVVFLDADLLHVQPWQIDQITTPVLYGPYAMVAALCGTYHWWNRYRFPLITGQRAVLRTVLNRVPSKFWQGYRIEAGISEMAERTGPIGVVRWENVPIVSKWQKLHANCEPYCARRGFLDNVKMFRDVTIAFAEARKIP